MNLGLAYTPTAVAQIESHARLFGDDGVDPILGPPYPPINYQLFQHSTQPRLTWTVPDVNLFISGEDTQPGGEHLTLLELFNYDRPAWDNGATYIINSAVVHSGTPYRSLQEPNIGHNPASSPAWWGLDTTVFALYEMRPLRGETEFTQRVRSDNSPQTHGLAEYRFVVDGETLRFESTLDFENLLDSHRVYYVSGTAGDTVTTSPLLEMGEPNE